MSDRSDATPAGSDVTALLAEASGGNREAFDRLVPLVYEELKRQAAARLRLEREGHTLNATALVHETYVRLVGQAQVEWKGRAHFFAVAAQAMRRILINHAEGRNAKKRRGKAVHIALERVADFVTDDRAGEILAVDEALRELESFNERGARVVEYRFFGGLSNEEIAEVMGLSEATVRRSWRAARAWLRDSMSPSPPGMDANGGGIAARPPRE